MTRVKKYKSNKAAFAELVRLLENQGKLSEMDVAMVQAGGALAEQLDADATVTGNWSRYLEVLAHLKVPEPEGDSEFDQFLSELNKS